MNRSQIAFQMGILLNLQKETPESNDPIQNTPSFQRGKELARELNRQLRSERVYLLGFWDGWHKMHPYGKPVEDPLYQEGVAYGKYCRERVYAAVEEEKNEN